MLDAAPATSPRARVADGRREPPLSLITLVARQRRRDVLEGADVAGRRRPSGAECSSGRPLIVGLPRQRAVSVLAVVARSRASAHVAVVDDVVASWRSCCLRDEPPQAPPVLPATIEFDHRSCAICRWRRGRTGDAPAAAAVVPGDRGMMSTSARPTLQQMFRPRPAAACRDRPSCRHRRIEQTDADVVAAHPDAAALDGASRHGVPGHGRPDHASSRPPATAMPPPWSVAVLPTTWLSVSARIRTGRDASAAPLRPDLSLRRHCRCVIVTPSRSKVRALDVR